MLSRWGIAARYPRGLHQWIAGSREPLIRVEGDAAPLCWTCRLFTASKTAMLLDCNARSIVWESRTDLF